MRLGKYLSSLTKPELEELKDQINLTEDEATVFEMLSKGKGNIQIADRCSVSIGTVANRVKCIKAKMDRVCRR